MTLVNLKILLYGCVCFWLSLTAFTLAEDPVVVVGSTKDPGIPMMPGDPKWSPEPSTTNKYHDFGTIDQKYSTTTLKLPDVKSTTSMARRTTVRPTRIVTQRFTKPKTTSGPSSTYNKDGDGNRIDLDKDVGDSSGRVCPFCFEYLTVLLFALVCLLPVQWP